MGLGSRIRNPRSRIRKKPILDPETKGQKSTRSQIRIRNTAFWGVPLVSCCEELSILLISSLEGFPCFAHQFFLEFTSCFIRFSQNLFNILPLYSSVQFRAPSEEVLCLLSSLLVHATQTQHAVWHVKYATWTLHIHTLYAIHKRNPIGSTL